MNKVAKKLSDISISTKCYLSLLKTLLSKEKMPCILPVFGNIKYIADFKEKSEIFTSFFAFLCPLIPIKSVLSPQSTLLTEKALASRHFSKKDIL